MTSKTNPYVNFFDHRGEQELHDSLTVELIQFYGYPFYYIPRSTPNIEELFGEDATSRFEDLIEIEALITTVDDYEGDGDFLSKFGVEIRDNAKIVISKCRFDEEFGSRGFLRPKEGDLMYHPLTGATFEISFVEDENPFYHRGKLYLYVLTLELFEFSHEEFETGYSEVDELEDDLSYILSLTLGAGSGTYVHDEWVYQGVDLGSATAKAQVKEYEVGTLKLKNIHGLFLEATPVVGDTGGASYTVTSFDPLINENDVFSDNREIEDRADVVLDFDEDDPFSEGGDY